MTNLKLAVIPGDGIGQEIVPEGIKALEAVIPSDVTLQYTEFDLGARRYHRTGEILTDTDLEVIDQHDAILLGAIGDPSVASGVLERGLLLKLRFALDHYVNLCARALKVFTQETVAPCVRARFTRSHRRFPSIQPLALSALCATHSNRQQPVRLTT